MGNVGIIYLYDGTFDGLLCCVFESYDAKEIPVAIYHAGTFEYTLYPVKQIETLHEKSERVLRSISGKISCIARELVQAAFLSCSLEKELLILKFLHLGYRYGASAVNMLQDEDVSKLHKAVRFVRNETHLLCGFVRFSDSAGGLAAVIGPQNNVLPLLLPHFCTRYPEENLVIYDKTHGLAGLYRPHQMRLMEVESMALPSADEAELRYRRLWKRFYDTIAIKGRYNPKCRQTHCPNRYWDYMTEFSALSPDGTIPMELDGIAAVKQIPTTIGK